MTVVFKKRKCETVPFKPLLIPESTETIVQDLILLLGIGLTKSYNWNSARFGFVSSVREISVLCCGRITIANESQNPTPPQHFGEEEWQAIAGQLRWWLEARKLRY